MIPGICAGLPYTVSVTASKAFGTSPASGLSEPVVPLAAQPPTAPLILLGTCAGSGSALVKWAPPAAERRQSANRLHVDRVYPGNCARSS